MVAIDRHCRQIFAGLGLTSFDSIVRFFMGDRLPRKTTVIVFPQTMKDQDGRCLQVYYKQYEYRPASWRFVGRRSKAGCEFQNYEVFGQLGIRCAQCLAWGQQRDAIGRLRRAFILTRAIPEALTLGDFIACHCPNRASSAHRRMRLALGRQLAEMTRKIHGAGFFHNDLAWRNVLVAPQPSAEPAIWWIDCPRGFFDRWSPWRRERRLKDLALLDKSAATLCSRGERLAFMKQYLGRTRLDSESRLLARDTLAYRKSRWPEDWDEG